MYETQQHTFVSRHFAIVDMRKHLTDAECTRCSVVAGSAPGLSSDLESVRPSSYGEEDLQLQLALAMSKEEHDEEMKRRKGDEFKLQMALEESRKTTDHDVSTLLKFFY